MEAESRGNTLKALGISIETTTLWRNELIIPENYLKKDEKLAEILLELKKKYSLSALPIILCCRDEGAVEFLFHKYIV